MKTLAITAAFLAVAGLAVAQEAPGKPERKAPPLIVALDQNGDGVISLEEMDTAPDALRELDANLDNQLTRDELMPERKQGKQRHHRGEACEKKNKQGVEESAEQG